VRPRLAGTIAVAAGGTAAIAGTVAAPGGPWWISVLLFAAAAATVWRLLRPQPRTPRWEDEI
jgi:membrane protein implicated in regulation of membrane protease activity